MTDPKLRADISDYGATNRIVQAEDRISAISDRIREGLAALTAPPKRDIAWLAREASVPTSTMHSIMQGSIPRADNAVKIASALGRSVEWLLLGEGPPIGSAIRGMRQAMGEVALRPGWSEINMDDWILLPEVDARRVDESGRLVKLGAALVRRDELARFSMETERLWIARMPSSAMPEVAREGETIICIDAEQPLSEGGAYIFHLGKAPVVRRFTMEHDWSIDEEGQIEVTVTTSGEQRLLTLVPVGRILASISYRPA